MGLTGNNSGLLRVGIGWWERTSLLLRIRGLLENWFLHCGVHLYEERPSWVPMGRGSGTFSWLRPSIWVGREGLARVGPGDGPGLSDVDGR